ncbi:MAG: 3-phosphoshikimate 1-carboxyvinyltransferase [Syntrophus sp. (in: bacteria)]|nr:3-phosphoshikimate 1-carboxyvinyltransferase [Syntrophus sp. (in: bacteria)]
MIEIHPVGKLKAAVSVPGSKSYTQRALVTAALAAGTSRLCNVLFSEDTRYLMTALGDLGAGIRVEGHDLIVAGTGGRIAAPKKELFVGNNGTALRFLTALASLGTGTTVVTGEPRLCERPLSPLIEALDSLGVTVHTSDGNGYPPVRIEASGIRGGQVAFRDAESSQYISALLLSAPYAGGDVTVRLEGRTVSQPYIDMTIEVMRAFGAMVTCDGDRYYRVPGRQCYLGREYAVDGDASSASYFFLAAALCRGAVTVMNMNPKSRQGDLRLLYFLEQLGCSVRRGESWIEVTGHKLPEGEHYFDMGDMPDMAPTMAVLAAFRPGRTVIGNCAHLRIKESDRIASLVTELNRIGVGAREMPDGLVIDGGRPRGAQIETYNDHRIAMSFAVAGLAAPGMKIVNEQCVNKSFPGFWDALERLT